MLHGLFLRTITIMISVLVLVLFISLSECTETVLKVFTVATHENDGFNLFKSSAKKYGYDMEVLGFGREWLGGDMNAPGGGFKVNLMKEALEKYKDDENTIIIYVDSFDVVFTSGTDEMIKAFMKEDTRLLFSAEDFLWPDLSLENQYPKVKGNEKRFLNSGAFIGYAPVVYEAVTFMPIANTDDDQLFYTKYFLKNKNNPEKVKLDVKAAIFSNLNGAVDDNTLKFKGAISYVYNSKTGTQPLVLHGNGPVKPIFYSIANYLSDRWTPTHGCTACDTGTISLEGLEFVDYPSVTMAVFFDHPILFAEEFFENIAALIYPKEKIDLFIYFNDQFNVEDIDNFVDKYGQNYRSHQVHSPVGGLFPSEARNRAISECEKMNCKYYFSIDGDVQLTNIETLISLMEKNRTVIAPMVRRPDTVWTNFWGAIAEDGFYKRSMDYIDIINYNILGQWNIPYMTGIYLIHGNIMSSLKNSFVHEDMDADMALCGTLRKKGIFMFVDNMDYYGLLVNSDNVEIDRAHPELYSLFDNKLMWEMRYIHENYSNFYDIDIKKAEKCPEVFQYPLMSEKFCAEFIDELENFGMWSNGKHEDQRLDGGYENVPTVDIHMNQIGWENHWLQVLKDYIAPVNEKAYMGYSTESRATMNFVVRYKTNEQRFLRPHHDSSTWSLIISLNKVDVDFEGGGTNFLRQNCNVTKNPLGNMLMFPGRLTHLHEGLEITKGTRYIFVCFVDP